MLSRRDSKRIEDGCFPSLPIQLPKLPQRPNTRAAITPSRVESTHRRRSSAIAMRRSSVGKQVKLGDISMIEEVVAERRRIDVSVLVGAERKTQFPFRGRPTRFQNLPELPKPKEAAVPHPDSSLPKNQSEAARVIKSLNWVSLRLDNFFPSVPSDRCYTGKAKTLYCKAVGESEWVSAEVLGYCEDKGGFEVRLLEGRPGLGKIVHRVNLMIDGEGQEFTEILARAHTLKAEAELRLNTDLYIACEYSKQFELSGNPPQFLDKITHFVGDIWHTVSDSKQKSLISDIDGFYDYAYLKGVLYEKWDEDEVVSLRAKERLIPQPNYYRLENRDKVISTDFEEKLKRFKGVSLYTHPAAFRLIDGLRYQFKDISDSEHVFQHPPSASSWIQFSQSRGPKPPRSLASCPLHLPTFFKFQKFRIQQAKSFLSKVWIHTAACAIHDSSSMPLIYKERLSKAVELMVQGMVWEEVVGSLRAFRGFLGERERAFRVEVEFKHDGKGKKLDIELNPTVEQIRTITDYYVELVLRMKDDIPRISSWAQATDTYQTRESTSEEVAIRTEILALISRDTAKIELISGHIASFRSIALTIAAPDLELEAVSVERILAHVATLERHMSDLLAAQKQVFEGFLARYTAGVFVVDCTRLRTFLLEMIKQGLEGSQGKLHMLLAEFGEYIDGECERLLVQLQQEVTSIDELIESMSNAQRIHKVDFPKIKAEVDRLTKGLIACRWVWCHPHNSNSATIIDFHGKVSQLEDIIRSRMDHLDKDKPKYMRKLEQERDALKASVKALYGRYQEFIQIPIGLEVDLEQWMTECATFAKSIIAQIKEVESTRQRINHRESVLSLEPSKQYLLDKLISSSPVVLQFALKSSEIHTDMQIWKNTQLKKIDPFKINEVLSTMKAEFFAALPKITSSQQQVATMLCREFDQFLTYTEVANLLQSISLKERHWKQICEILKLPNDVYLDIGTVVSKDGHLPPKFDLISSVVQTADRELRIEKQLRDAKSKFLEMTFAVEQVNDTFLLTQQNEIRESIVEFREVIRTIADNQCVQEFKLQAGDWSKKLDTLEQLLGEWAKAQDCLMQLAEFFNTVSNQSAHYEVFAEYQKLTSRLNKILVEIQEQPQVLRCREMHIKYFQSCAQQLHACTAKLSQAKEDDSQFYSLSDSQMMQLLSAEDMY